MLALPIILLGLLSSASALVLPRHRALARAPTPVELAPRAEASAPADWTSHNLEDYETYHIRYMALDCEDQHNSTFFTTCCHPRSASNTTAISAACTPSAKALASASAEYGPDCEETSSVASASATATAPATESTEECSEEETSTAKPTSTSKAAAATTTKAEASAAKGGAGALGQGAPTTSSSKAEPTSSKAATTTKAATSTKEATSTKTSSSAAATGSTFTGGVATYFLQNGVAGACGQTHSDSDLIAAIDQDRYGSSSSTSSLCGKQVKITNTSNQKTVTVTIADDCPTCKNSNSIDLSEGAFKQIATIAEGEVDISWEFL